MVRFFLILMALAAMVWIGQRYFTNNPSGGSFWDSMGAHMDSSATPAPAAASPSPTPVEHTVKGSRTRLRELAEKELSPLEPTSDFSPQNAVTVLQDVRKDLGEYRFDPDYPRLMQADTLLGQALQERQGYVQRVQQDEAKAKATPKPADSSSSALHSSGLQPQVLHGEKSTDSFFKEATLKQWDQRCAAYKSAVEQLLTPSRPED